MAAEPVTLAAEDDDPKSPSSIWASTGAALSLSRLRKAAIDAVSKDGTRSLPGATRIGAMRSDSRLAGPRDVKSARRVSQSLVPKNVKQSDRVTPTATRFFAVA